VAAGLENRVSPASRGMHGVGGMDPFFSRPAAPAPGAGAVGQGALAWLRGDTLDVEPERDPEDKDQHGQK
jgi:hypothetical protein